MAVSLDHLMVRATDPSSSAALIAEILDLPVSARLERERVGADGQRGHPRLHR